MLGIFFITFEIVSDLTWMRRLILKIIDPFYFIFKPIMDLQTYRYGVCGSGNTLLDILVYFISYNYILDKQPVHFGFLTISPHIAAFILSFMVSFPIGFFLMRTVVFAESTVRGRVQLVRYFSVLLLNIILNYVFLKIMVEYMHVYPTVAKVFITCLIVLVSYLLQRKFTFKVAKSGV